MNALVIGGNGFIGTNLVTLLSGAGMKVRIFDRYPSRFSAPLPNTEYVTGDLGNHGALHEIVQDIDVIFHLAYTTLPQTSNDDPVYDIRSNLIDTVQLLEESNKAKVKKFIFISSGGTVYGIPQICPIPEEHPAEPICSYGITKLAIEKYLNLFWYLYGLEYVVIRMSNPYGPGQNPDAKQGAIGVFLGKIARGETIKIWGDGKVVRDYLYIEDAVNALLAAAKYEPTATQPRLFNIGFGEGVSLNQLVEEMGKVVDRHFKVEYTPAREVDVPANVLDISRAKTYLGWCPETKLPVGLSKSWQWIKSIVEPVTSNR